MAQFIGRIKGSKGEATRLGGKAAGMTATAKGWHCGADAVMEHGKTGDVAFASLNGGTMGDALPVAQLAYTESTGSLRVYLSGIGTLFFKRTTTPTGPGWQRTRAPKGGAA